jgi:hypothetical protein
MVLKAALNHNDVSVTQKYLEADVMAAIARCDFTRRPKAGWLRSSRVLGLARLRRCDEGDKCGIMLTPIN